jgi:uridine kinase
MNAKREFQLVSQRTDVEVRLADGQVISGERGAPVGDFLAALKSAAPIVAAVVDHELRELTYPVECEARVTPVTMADADGARIYRRSLNFLLEMAFADLHPKAKLNVDHSISFGGYYCQVSGRGPLTDDELGLLRVHMHQLVESDMPFQKLEMPLEEAISYFEQLGYEDKVSLLRYRRKSYLTLYKLAGRMDYHHGYMVPSTGYLKWFDLLPTNGGFTLRFPRRHAPTELENVPKYPKLLAAFRQYGDWLVRLGIDTVGALDAAIEAGRAHEIVLVSEALHEQNVSEVAQEIAQKHARIVLIAGPSSSGKTTFSRRLMIQLLALGVSPFPLELDNYFVDRDKTPLCDDGTPDFESIDAVDLTLLASDLQRLVQGEAVQLPRYDFRAGVRTVGDVIRLQDGQPIILEGIHGLNPRLIPPAAAGDAFRIYVSALTQLNLDRHNRVSTTDTRLIRRIARDARERGYAAKDTIARWEAVRRGEKQYIFPYQENADVMFNSAAVYELAALKPLVEPLLRQVPYGTAGYIEAKRLLALLEWFVPVGKELVPENSIVREFLGGSNLKEFKIWKKADASLS